MDQGRKAGWGQAGGLSNRTEISVPEAAASRQPVAGSCSRSGPLTRCASVKILDTARHHRLRAFAGDGLHAEKLGQPFERDTHQQQRFAYHVDHTLV